jgi:transposase
LEKADLSLENIQKCAKGSLKEKGVELHRSIQGFFEDHHRFLLNSLMRTIAMIEAEIATLTERVTGLMKPYQALLDLLDEIPGIDKVSAQSVLSEIGITLENFLTIMSFTSWAGLCPGNNESAGKRKSGKSPVRKHPFKTIMVEIAWAAIKKKNSYYKNKYYRLKARRGPKKAIIAIAHRIAKAIYTIIKTGEPYKDLGEDYLMNINKSKRLYNLKKQAQLLGFDLVPAKN